MKIKRWFTAGAVTALAFSGCGGATGPSVRTVTVTTSSGSPSVSPSERPKRRKRRRPTPKPTAASSSSYVACDANIRAKATTTTCPFAENAFYEYWVSGEAAHIRVHSPATGSTYETSCSSDANLVSCSTDDGGVVKFSQASVADYTQSQADAFAAAHNTGTDDSAAVGSDDSAPEPSQAGGRDDDPNFCDDHDCIPNYPNGNGSTVQCADGTYSDSGGIQGACSHHGGVG